MPNADTSNENPVFLRRQLNCQDVGDATLLDGVAALNGADRVAQLFFNPGTDLGEITAGKGAEIIDARVIGGAVALRVRTKDDSGAINLLISGSTHDITPPPPETELFAGLNVGFAVRNGETAKVTLDWLQYHVAHHGMNGALILDQARPGSDETYANTLRQGAKEIAGLKRLVLLETPVPLGTPDLPAEAHPFNAPAAPGKDRMVLPDPDPWAAPLGALGIYELARARFLNTARAVANIDIHDLLAPEGGENIFDRACKATSGCITLEGIQCYPWRLRKGQNAGFGDHICVQFDAARARRRWCVAPQKTGEKTVWRLVRVVGANPAEGDIAQFHRHMTLRHPTQSVSKIVPKTSLIEDPALITRAGAVFAYKPVPMPAVKLAKPKAGATRTAIVTTMKNEGPFILEWIAYHRAIGVSDFLIYTNDCTDGTDTMLEILQQKGIVQHRNNPFKNTGLKPQHAAFQAAEKEKIVKNADWLICMDVDEFINIHTGDGRLADLFAAIGNANMVSLTWRLFGNGDIHEYQDGLICEKFTRCAPQLIRKPHQAWGFKTLFRNQAIFKKLGVHRPKGLNPQLWESIDWVNGSGAPMPSNMYRNGWRSTTSTYGYDLVTLNHYAVRSCESFLVKRDRGRVNHVDRDQGLAYWFRMNNNTEGDRSIHRMLPALKKELADLMADPDITAAHDYSVAKHREKITALRATENYTTFYSELTGERMERLSKMLGHFGANVFLAGPGVIPDEIVQNKPETDFFFTVDKGKTEH